MFVGHYGPAAAAAGDRIPLWHAFLAVQFLDLLWAPFVLAGIEHVRIVENFTASNHFDLYHMPFTHSLPAAIGWSLVAAIAYRFLRPAAGKAGAGLIAALVFSHWALDLIMHKPDLELWFGGPKAGFGLWDNRPLSTSIELGAFLIGMLIYLRRSMAIGPIGRVAPLVLMLALFAAQLVGNFGPPPGGAAEAAQTALIAYIVAAVLAAWCDVSRSPRTSQ